MVNIKLEKFEFEMAAMVGLRRSIEAKCAGYEDKHGFEGTGWDIGIEGACGELAVAKYLDVYWDGSNKTFKKNGDVLGIEVRTTEKHSNSLILRGSDPEDRIYVLVTGRAPNFKIQGFTRGNEYRKMKYFRAPNGRPPAYFIPGNELHDITLLKHDIWEEGCFK